jgi:protein SCO1/2
MRRGALLLGLLAIGSVLLLLGVAYWAAHSSQNPSVSASSNGGYRGSRPPSGLKLPDVSLRDYHGRLIRTHSLRGKVVLITFLDTACKTTCPIVAAAVGAGLRLLDRSERVQLIPLAISVDPPVDTPGHIRAFLAPRHALGLDYLIGTNKQLRPIWKAFGVVSSVQTGSADIHSSDVRIFDRRGIWVSTLHAIVDLTPANLSHDLRLAISGGKG